MGQALRHYTHKTVTQLIENNHFSVPTIRPADIFNHKPCGDVLQKPVEVETAPAEPTALKQAVRQARIETADRTSVVVELRDAAKSARLRYVGNEALDSGRSSHIPMDIDLFDRGISHGDQPRLWIDVVAHVVMGRDKREYRFVQAPHALWP